jgi:hypothetical protein
MSDIRTKINAFPDDGADADRDALTAEYMTLESQYRAAVITESADDDPDKDPPRSTDPEDREIARLIDRVGVGDYLDAAAAGRAVDGAAAELRCAVLGDDAPAEYMPIDVLLPRAHERQLRADAATNIATAVQDNQSTIAGRVFAVGALEYLGVDRPTVPFGTMSYVSLTAGGAADARSPGAALDAVAGVFTTKAINPSRVQARVLYDNINDVKMRGSSDALANDLRMQISDKLDAVGLQGQAAVANTSPALTGIIGALANPTNPTDAATWADFLSAYDDAVDGKYAMDDTMIRLLVNADTWKYARTLALGNQVNGGLLRDRLPAGRFRVSANMPETPDSGGNDTIATALSYTAGMPGLVMGRGFTQAIWRGIRLIRDMYTHSAEDQTAVTATVYVGQDMVNSDRFRRLEFKTS